jgi:hypothetical protein
MFNTKASPANSRQTNASQDTQGSSSPRWLLLLDIGVLLVMGIILFWGTSTQFSNIYGDMTRYQCYAIAFWQGQAGLQAHGLQATSQSQCAFMLANSSSALTAKLTQHHLPAFLINLINAQPSTQPFRALPPEYPFLTLIPFSLPLLAPFAWYQGAFALLMTLLAWLLYVVLLRGQSRSAAIAFAFYLALGSWATATDRFDLVPAALTLGAILLAGKARWKWAFALLALATLYKFYPVILAIPFLIAQQQQYKGIKWTAWKRWSAFLITFAGLGILILLISMCFNVINTLIPFTYFFGRPFQAESFPATLLWIGGHLGIPSQYVFTYQSLNIISPLTRLVSPLALILELGGLAYTFWLQWRGKLSIAEVSLLTVLIIMVTGKVFSPQYLIWVTPLIALVGKANWKWLLTWGLVGALTTFMFPWHYDSIQEIDHYYLVIVARDLLILGLTCVLLYWYSKRKPEKAETEVVLKQEEPVNIVASGGL